MQQQRSRRLEGAVAIVTGGASGFGEATSVLFASEGAKVVILDVNEELGQKVEKQIQSEGGEAKFIKHDVTDADGWKTVVNSVLSTFGKLDILVNNAGILSNCAVTDISLEEWRKVNSINVEGVFLGTQAVIPAMKKNGQMKGSIINISSISALKGFGGGGVHYSASQGAVRAMTKAVAAELGDTKIRVNSIHPGFCNTPMLRAFFDRLPDKGNSVIKRIEAMQKGTLGEPKDIAYACLYLASDESKFVNGIELIVDGGLINVSEKIEINKP